VFLSGDRNITNNSVGGLARSNIDKSEVGNLKQTHTTTQGAGWNNAIHQNQGDVCLGDGSVQQFSSSRLRDALKSTDDVNNQLAFPGTAP
jgi:hypothetical protein